jgi:ABC-type multidrug transport system fused ATPase/permease subunit
MKSTSHSTNRKEYTNAQLAGDLFRFLKPYQIRLYIAFTLRAISEVVWLYPPLAIAQLIGYLSSHAQGYDFPAIQRLFILFVLATIVRYFCGYVSTRLTLMTSEQMDVDAQLAGIRHMFNLDIAWHEKENTGNKLKKLTRGADSIDRILRIVGGNYIPLVINFTGIAIILAKFNIQIAALTFVFIITYYLVSSLFRKRGSQAARLVNQQEEEMEGLLFESLNNIRTVKVLGMSHALSSIILTTGKELYRRVQTRIFWLQTGNWSRGFYSQIFQILAFVFISYGVIHGTYGVGFLILFYGYFERLLQAVSGLADTQQDFVIAKLSIARMFEIFAEPVTIDSLEGKVLFPSDWKKISFQNVSFGYGENAVLQNVTFDIHRGEKVGIIGLSGAGKSTIFKLLLKEHESYTGEILVDDVPLRSIQKRDYFNYSAVVLQDTEVFNFTLKENITLANNAEADNEALLQKAITTAHVDDFISRLTNGVDTLIGEKGVKLSGGERQRVGIARAVFKDPQLLLLDEATSHLDIESEEKIRLSLHEFFQSVTAVVIAHRLTTIKEMDRIIVLEGGTILEEGTFDALYAKRGRFHELWEKQSL